MSQMKRFSPWPTPAVTCSASGLQPVVINPIAKPGTYQVRLTVDGRSESQSFELKINPNEIYTRAQTDETIVTPVSPDTDDEDDGEVVTPEGDDDVEAPENGGNCPQECCFKFQNVEVRPQRPVRNNRSARTSTPPSSSTHACLVHRARGGARVRSRAVHAVFPPRA